MEDKNVVRAWKNVEFRYSLSEEERAALPAHPAGLMAMADDQVTHAVGGSSEHILTWGCCHGFTTDPGGCSFVCYTVGSGPEGPPGNACSYGPGCS
jgi:mersacidin/lichenicidin family type 2 lantibiotic